MQPNIEVGVLFSNAFSFTLKGIYLPGESDHQLEGAGTACLEGSLFRLYIGSRAFSLALPVTLEPQDYSSSCFELNDVTIGKGFHWERKENQKFKGALKIIREKDQLIAINTLPLEDYLISVISSEMSATASLHLLRAHAVISRSWLLAQKSKEQKLKKKGEYVTLIEREGERIKWYDREDHHHFDVCADDHCQRYQGITKASTANAEAAVADTCGEVLVYNNEICDARYSKACGGITERFENVWEPVEHAYLTRVIDNDTEPTGYNLDLTDESAAAKWIPGNPPAFCNTSDKNILSQVLNDYDQETADFFRWKVTISQKELQHLLKKKIDVDLGEVIDLVPILRGVSGRLIKLKIVGSKGSLILGKELEIRKALSESHLYSSAFVIEKDTATSGEVPHTFTLIGAGWGHGVGLCQIGAAVMGDKGYSYHKILAHYFKGAQLVKRY